MTHDYTFEHVIPTYRTESSAHQNQSLKRATGRRHIRSTIIPGRSLQSFPLPQGPSYGTTEYRPSGRVQRSKRRRSPDRSVAFHYGSHKIRDVIRGKLAANSLIRTAKNVKVYRVSAQLSTVIPTLAQTLDRSPNANISADNVWTSLLPFVTTRPDSGARALSKL